MEAVPSSSNSELDDIPMNQNEGRDYADTLVRESLQALYENGWVFII